MAGGTPQYVAAANRGVWADHINLRLIRFVDGELNAGMGVAYCCTLDSIAVTLTNRGSTMFQFHLSRRTVAIAACVLSFSYSLGSSADDMGSFATGGYARGLRTHEMMVKIDTNDDGMISKDEWVAFQEKSFAMLDKGKTGKLDAKQFISASGGELSSFATGGYAKGLRTKEMMHKIDADGDGTVSHDEFIAYQTKIFEMMDTSTTHKGMLGKEEIMFSTGGANKH